MLIKKNLPSIALILTIGLAAFNPLPLLASRTVTAAKPVYLAQEKQSGSSWSDGTYLYGQSATHDQLGQEYLVFQVKQGKVVGVFYMPSSEYSCFQGTMEAQRMNLSIKDIYENTTYPYSIAFQQTSPIASEGNQIQRSLGLQGYKPIDEIRESEQELLDICQKSF